jgi:hypothetical protein
LRNGMYLLLGLSLAACACSGSKAQLRLLVVPVVYPGVTTAEVDVTCDGCTLITKLPGKAWVDVNQEPGPALAELRGGEELFYSGELESASKGLEAGFAMLQGSPHLLPRSKEDRSRVYKSLLTLYRLREKQGLDAGEVGDWMARVMPDLFPSVTSAPPAVEASLTRCKERATIDPLLISVSMTSAAADCRAFLDSRELGVVPFSGLAVPRARHSLQVECPGGWRSAVRSIPLDAKRVKLVLDPAADDMVQYLEDGGLALGAGGGELETQKIALGMVAQSEADCGLLLHPGDRGAELVFLSPRVARSIGQAGANPIILNQRALIPPGAWRKPVAITTGAIATMSLALGILMNIFHEKEADRLNNGWSDTRAQMSLHKTLSIGGYGGAALLSSVSLGMFLWSWLDQGDPGLTGSLHSWSVE